MSPDAELDLFRQSVNCAVVLERMARGLLNKQIAWELKISEKTVKMHRALLLDQLGVATSADAIRIAVEAGL